MGDRKTAAASRGGTEEIQPSRTTPAKQLLSQAASEPTWEQPREEVAEPATTPRRVEGAGDWLADASLMSALGLGDVLSTDLQNQSPHQAASAPAQPASTQLPTPKRNVQKKGYIPFEVSIPVPMTGEEFKAAAGLQAFGSATAPIEWHNIKASYTPDRSPVTVMFEASLVLQLRGEVNAARGIETEASGAVAGAQARAQSFQSRPASDEKTAILAEIDRRYYVSSGADSSAKIQPNDEGRSAQWRAIRDEVLFQHQRIAGMPDKVRALIRVSIEGRDLRPADYEQLFRIVQHLEALPPGAIADYASKVTGTTSDLITFERSIDRYRDDLAQRELVDRDRAEVHDKLLGLDEVYKLYRRYTDPATLGASGPTAQLSGQPSSGTQGDGLREQLEQQLARHGFSSVAEFAAYLSRFEQTFEAGAARIALDLLGKYAGKLYRESERYRDPAVVGELHRKLGGFRADHREFTENAKIWNTYAIQANDGHARLGELSGGPRGAIAPTPGQAQAGKKAETSKARATATIQDLAREYPIFAEEDLPVDRRLDKELLARADESSLAGVLQAHLADRTKIVVEAQRQIESHPELIYKMDKLMPAFYAQLDIQPGSIHDQLIRDKMRQDAIAKLVTGVAIALVAIALTVVSLGAATPAVVAAGASIGAAGLSTYMAYDEYQSYEREHCLGEAGLAEDPSVVWLVLAVVGVGVDVGAATRAMRSLAPAAKALDAGGDLADFTRAVEALQKAKQLDAKIAAAAEQAARARKAYSSAKGDFSLALGKAYALPGPFTDPDVYRALVKMAAAKLKEGVHSLTHFLDELKQARLAAKLGELSPEELMKVKQAWEQAERLASHSKPNDLDVLNRLLRKVADPVALERLQSKVPDAEQLERLLEALGNGRDLERLLQHMSADELQKFLSELADPTRLHALVKRYEGEVLKHYGGHFFKEFKGVDESTLKHLSGFDGIDKKVGIKGCHDEDLFHVQLSMPPDGVLAPPPGVGRGPVVKMTFHPSNAAIKRIEYSFWKQDRAGNIVMPLDAKAATYSKTTIKDLATNITQWRASADEALEDAIRKMTFPKGDASFSGTSKSGLRWTGWYRNGKVQTVFVDF